ncbi:restriction endonuclease subunit S [Vibrio metschnikovii]|uniref:restriction endonuclease subunit S n=1 Tax=Vibrio metschnikovii TaxID=28172 RepID=UPI001C2FBDD0|nr:restriction endonuclease subunit S [Vibrio metschnikovii]
MSELPKGWVKSSLDKIVPHDATISDGDWVESKDQDSSGSVRLIQLADIGDGDFRNKSQRFMNEEAASRLNCSFLKEGDLLVARMPDPLGRACLFPNVGQRAVTVVDVCFIRETSLSALSNKLLQHWFNSPYIRGLISSNASGSTRKRITRKKLEKFEFPIPPLAEQKRIVAKLDEVLAQVDTIKARLDRIPAILKRFRQSVLAAAVSGKLTEEWRGAADDFNSNNKLIPSSWEIRAAKDICVTVQSGSTPQNDPFNQNGTIPFLKVYNIVNQQIDFDYKPQFITHETHSKKLKRSVAYPGDILMNIVGPPLGKVAILTEQYPEWNLNQAITLFRVNEDILLNRYLYFVLCEGELVRAVMPETKGSVGQVNISLSQCRDSLIPLPPKEEQKEIVRLVDQYFAFADTIEAQVKKAQARVDNLTQSILAKAFRGELVAQDPNDEPADKLLERIAKARTEAEQLAKAAKKAVKSQR